MYGFASSCQLLCVSIAPVNVNPWGEGALDQIVRTLSLPLISLSEFPPNLYPKRIFKPESHQKISLQKHPCQYPLDGLWESCQNLHGCTDWCIIFANELSLYIIGFHWWTTIILLKLDVYFCIHMHVKPIRYDMSKIGGRPESLGFIACMGVVYSQMHHLNVDVPVY